MSDFTLKQHQSRILHLRAARNEIHSCTREYRIFHYLPGQIIYYLGDYPRKLSFYPTEYDYELLKSYAENGVQLIQVHEEWNDSIEKYGADKWSSYDPEGLRAFVDLCHSFGIKVLAYCSASFIHEGSKYFDERFVRGSGGCMDMHYNYRRGWAGSAEWRDFLLPRSFGIMDRYGFDGLFNDWGYDWQRSTMYNVSESWRNPEHPADVFDPEAEDLIHLLYEGVKSRNGIYKLHIGGNTCAPIRGKFYDYLWIGEGEREADFGVGKMLAPYIVPCPDKPKLTNNGEIAFDADAYFAKTIPFMQFPLLTHGRPTMGQCIDVPGVTQYNTDKPERLYQYFQKVRAYADAHPKGPFVYSEWSQIPDDVEDYPQWCHYLKLYQDMVTDGTVAFLEIRLSDAIRSVIGEKIVVSEFVGNGRYMVVSNLDDKPYTLRLTDVWRNRETPDAAKEYVIPSMRMIFLEKA